MTGVWEHKLTGEIFEIFERKDRKEEGGYETNLYMKYIFSATKNHLPAFKTKKEFMDRMLNFEFIEKVPDLPE